MKSNRCRRFFKSAALFCACLLTAQSALSFAALSGAAQSPEFPLTLKAVDGVCGGKASVNGAKVGNLGKSGGTVEGTLTFENLPVDDGRYFLLVCFASGSDDRYFDITTDAGIYRLNCPSTGSFDTVGSVGIALELRRGGSLTFGSDWYAPDLFRVEIYEKETDVFPLRVYENANELRWNENGLTVVYDLENGVYSLAKNGVTVVSDARAEFTEGGVLIGSDEFSGHEIVSNGADRLCVRHTGHPSFGGTLEQYFSPTDEGALTTGLLIKGAGRELSADRAAPLSAARGGVRIDGAVFLKIPFDNDKWEEPRHIPAANLCAKTTGYEAAALYGAESGVSLVVGSLTHGDWKTGADLLAHEGEVRGLTVYGGAADEGTRDLCAHGALRGEEISSPEIFIGIFNDWRAGLTAFGKACARTVAPAENDGYVPFGFNSWGSMQSSVSYGGMTAVSDYVKEHLQDAWSEGGNAVYINIDSYWDDLARNDASYSGTNREALADFVAHCRANGQQAGVYFTPFAAWLSDADALKNKKIEGTDYTYYDAALKKYDGSLYGTLDGGWALDPTHPGTVARFTDALNDFLALGFTYVKLDFLTHGALEGKHFDESVYTGMQAYNRAMKTIAEICAGKMFVNLSISPVFPYEYAQGRRVSCDAFSSIDNTKHVLSCLTSCFWEDEIYAFPDPDHLVISGVSDGAARCRITAGAICGSSFLVGDDLSKIKEGSKTQKRIDSLFGNREILSVAKLGRAFVPLSAAPGARCADAYLLTDGEDTYLAVFNFEKRPVTRHFELSALTGADPSGLTARELWRGEEEDLSDGELTLTLQAEDAALFKISGGARRFVGEAPFAVGALIVYAAGGK